MNEKSMFGYKHSLFRTLEKRILPFVSKPGRYIGNELNAVVKDHTGKLRIALAFPDIYEIGMSYLGQQILYNILNKRDDCVAERVYQVWPDMERMLRQLHIQIFSLETATPLAEFDVIGFSLTYELHATGMLNILDLAGIPLASSERSDSYPLVIAGGPAVLNPEPVADFLDAVFLGEGEDGVNEIADALIRTRGQARSMRLEELARIEGMYVPLFYEARYDGRSFVSLAARVPAAKDKIKVRTCPDLTTGIYPSRPLVPFIETTHDRLSVEIMRGCVIGCRFCQAGFQYRPRRCRQSSDIVSQVHEGISATGFDEVTLLSLSSTDYPGLGEMIAGMMPFMQQNHLALSLPSLRPGSFSPKMLEYLKSLRKTGITLAPEAGTQRLRDVLGKNITTKEILDAVAAAFDNEWTLVKLYFMIGLPTETDIDLEGMVDLIKSISHLASSKGGKKNVNVTISPFCPKPGTPWQWEAQIGPERIAAIYRNLSHGIKSRNVTLKFRDPNLAALEGAIGRGGRRMSSVILAAFRHGSRLDGWSEHFDFERWRSAFEECGYVFEELLAPRVIDTPLPWNHLDKGIPLRFLLLERERSLKGIPAPSAKALDRAKPGTVTADYGRPPKRQTPAIVAPVRAKVRLRYSRDERLRFYSHLDVMRAFGRALRRASIPVSFSQGYHVHMKLSFGPPLPLGYISDAEYIDIQLASMFEKNHVARLNETLPPGLSVTSSKSYFAKAESLTKIINCASYEVELEPLPDDAQRKIENLAENKSLTVVRTREGETRELEAGRFLHELSFENGILRILLGFTPDGYLRPSEVLQFGLGFPPELSQASIYRRTGLYLLQGVHRVDPLDLV